MLEQRCLSITPETMMLYFGPFPVDAQKVRPYYLNESRKLTMSVPLEVFCCYAREDQEMLEPLKRHLMSLQRSGQITLWSDTDLHAGVEREKERYRHLESADLILLLISPDFMSSDYCYHTVMERAIERHGQGNAHIIPILLRPVHWDDAPFAHLQVIPTNATPVTKWSDRDDAFYDVAGHINRFLSERHTPHMLDESLKHLRAGELSQKEPISSTSPHSSSGEISRPNQSISAPENRLRANAGDEARGTSTLIALPSLALISKPEAIEVIHIFKGHTKDVPHIALSTDGHILASKSLDSTIKLWNVPSSLLLHTLTDVRDTGSTSTGVSLSANGSILVSIDHGSVRLWDIQASQRLESGLRWVASVAVSGDGLLFVCGHLWGEISVANVQGGRAFQKIGHARVSLDPHYSNPITHLAMSRNGLILASGDKYGTIKLWNMQNRQELHTLKAGDIACMALSADGNVLVNGMTDGTIKIWNAQKGKRLHTLKSATKNVAVNGDGLVLASARFGDGKVLLWNTKTGKVLSTLTSQTNSVSSVALSADGRVLATGSSDGTITVWGIKA